MPDSQRTVREEHRSRLPAATDEEEVSAELAEVVRLVCSGLARKHGLAGLFRLVGARRLCRYRGALRQNPYDSWDDLWASFADGDRIWGLRDEEGDWALPYPHLPLGWTDVAEELPFRLTRRGTACSPRKQVYDDVTRADGTPLRAHGRIAAEVRIGILPVGPGGRPEAAFLTRLWTVVALGELKGTADGRLVYQPVVPGVARDPVHPGVPQRTSDWDDLRLRAEFGPGDYAPALGRFGWGDATLGYQHSFLPGFERDEVTRIDLVSPASCRRLMGLLSAPSPLTGVAAHEVRPEPDVDLCEPAAIAAYRRALESEAPPDLLGEHIRTPLHSLAHALERSIFHAEAERRLDRVLDAICGSLAAEVEGYLGPIEEGRARVKAELRALWGQ